MTALSPVLLSVFLVFCRAGGCIMTAPGFSSERVPVSVRLYLAGAVSLALAPLLQMQIQSFVSSAGAAQYAIAVLFELAIGVILGFLARIYFFALETLATSVAMTFGLANIFGAGVSEREPGPALSSFIVGSAVMLMFCADLHLEIIRGLHSSYEAAPPFASLETETLLVEIKGVLSQSYLLALRISSPFLLFGLVTNVAIGLLARITPQAQIFFISGPLVALLAIGAFWVFGRDFLSAFTANFGAWLENG